MVQEYLTSNGHNKYPFKDNAHLRDQDGVRLSNSCFLDIVYVAKVSYIKSAYLVGLEIDNNEQEIYLTFESINFDATPVVGSLITLPFGDVTDKALFTYNSDEVAIKVIVGQGMVDLLSVPGSHNYTSTATELEESAVISYVPRVKSIELYNWNKNTNLVEASPAFTFTGDQLTELDLTIEAGANVVFESVDGAIELEVIPGAGQGLFDGCAVYNVISSINAVPPDDFHNFLMYADHCYEVTPGENSIEFNNICTPKCSTDQLSNTVYYINRLLDAADTLSVHATGIYDDLAADIEDYNTNVAPFKKTPRYEYKVARFDSWNPLKYYYSFAFGFYNPSDADITLDLTTATHPTCTLREDSIRLKKSTGTTNLDTLILTTNVPCKSAAVLEFVIYGPPAAVFTLVGTFGAVAVNSVIALP